MKWISIETRKPRRGQRVIVSWKSGKKRHCDWDIYQGKPDEPWFFEYYKGEITHWMPMPEPPK